jgi:cell division septation protein DedD
MFPGAAAALVTRAAFRFSIGGNAVMNARVVTRFAVVLALATLAGCSREKIDWKSAEAADTVESYDHFIARHPDSDLATQARARVAQLNEDRDWKRASALDSAEGYRQFLAQHGSGKWSEEARIRIENFALDGTAMGPSGPAAEPEPVASPVVSASAPAASPVEPQPGTFGPRATGPAPSTPAEPVVADPSPRPAVPIAAPVASTPSPGQFGIQLGAFRSQEAALNDWKRLQARFDSDLHGLFARAVPVKQTAGQLFRLQAPVGNEARARTICASLSKQSQPCVVVLPTPP